MEVKYNDSIDKNLKLKHLGEGEWVNEADRCQFEYKGYECEVCRNFIKEPYAKEEHYSGGNLCGYVKIPLELKLYEKKSDLDLNCHGGITFNELFEFGEEKQNWIGFDCAHSCDYIPSIELFKKTDPEMIKFKEMFPYPKEFADITLFNPEYRDMDYCIEECKKIVDQLIEMVKNNISLTF